MLHHALHLPAHPTFGRGSLGARALLRGLLRMMALMLTWRLGPEWDDPHEQPNAKISPPKNGHIELSAFRDLVMVVGLRGSTVGGAYNGLALLVGKDLSSLANGLDIGDPLLTLQFSDRLNLSLDLLELWLIGAGECEQLLFCLVDFALRRGFVQQGLLLYLAELRLLIDGESDVLGMVQKEVSRPDMVEMRQSRKSR